jgi:hypothetical protein
MAITMATSSEAVRLFCVGMYLVVESISVVNATHLLDNFDCNVLARRDIGIVGGSSDGDILC